MKSGEKIKVVMVWGGEQWLKRELKKGGGVENVGIGGFKVGGVGVLHLKYQWKKLPILINTPIIQILPLGESG